MKYRSTETISYSPFKIIDNRIVPAGATIIVSVFDIHHNPELYPEPFVWNPHNFDPEKVASRPPYTFIPFGAGPRICIGEEMSVLFIPTIQHSSKNINKTDVFQTYIN